MMANYLELTRNLSEHCETLVSTPVFVRQMSGSLPSLTQLDGGEFEVCKQNDDLLYESAMHQGSATIQSADSVLVGVAGSGKTSSMTMALEEGLPVQRDSTPCANAPVTVRAITQTRIGVSQEKKLSRVLPKDHVRMVANTTKAVGSSLTYNLIRLPKSVDMSATPNYLRKLEKEMIRSISEGSQRTETLYDFRWCKMTDTGGQPQFLEIVPIFIHHISLGIITIKLNERLDHYPEIEYYVDGKPIGSPYKSCYTHEQIIRYCLRALASQASGRCDVKFLFMGTHKDLEANSIDESIEDKNKILRKMVNSFHLQKHVYYSNQGASDMIFAVNSKTPGVEDWEVMELVRSAIVESSDVPPISIPIKWFALEIALLRFTKETNQAVLLESECIKMAATFHFEEEFEVKAALRYLHKAKIIFYHEKKGLVVADIQFILDKLSEVVRYNIKLRTNPKQYAKLDYKWRRFCHYGILHSSCLDKFPERYIEGVFTAKDLLSLFVYLSIISEQGPDEYLMPCLLLAQDRGCVNPDPETQAVPALAIEFPEGSPTLGLYCSLVCYLMTVKKWRLAENDDKDPLLLTRNSIRFLAPTSLPGNVTLNDPLSNFFLVTFHGPLSIAERVCPIIRESILTGIHEISKTLNFLPPKLTELATSDSDSGQPFATFLCKCDTTPLHPAIISDDGDYLTCPYNCMYYEDISDKHKIWFQGSHICAPRPYTSSIESTSEGSPIAVNMSEYVATLPTGALGFLDKVLDWDQDRVDKDLSKIAEYMIDWEEKLSSYMELTDVEIHDLKATYSKPVLLRRAVLKLWKSKNSFHATYWSLLLICCKGQDSRTANAICMVLREKAAGL